MTAGWWLAGWVAATAVGAAVWWWSRWRLERHVEDALRLGNGLRHPQPLPRRRLIVDDVWGGDPDHLSCVCGDPGLPGGHGLTRCTPVCACRRLSPDLEPWVHDRLGCGPVREMLGGVR